MACTGFAIRMHAHQHETVCVKLLTGASSVACPNWWLGAGLNRRPSEFQVWATPLPRTVPADEELLDVCRIQLPYSDVAVRAAVTRARLY